MTLSKAEIDRFQRDGLLILDIELAETLVDKAVEGVSELLTYSRSDVTFHSHGARIQDAWRFIPHVRQIALDERVVRALRDLFGRRPLPFQTLNFSIGTEQKAHSDTIHFNSRPRGYMAGVWVALEDVDVENGALIYYPGSHLLPQITMRDIGLPPDQNYYHEYENHIAALIAKQHLTPSHGVMKKGQILVWHANLLHGGGPHLDKSRTRYSQVTHYFFEGCEYYTPMLSTETKVCWRNPEWITANAPYDDYQERLRRYANPTLLERVGRKLKKTFAGR